MNTSSFECFLVVNKGLMPVTIHGYIGSARRFTKKVEANPTIEQATEYINQMYQSKYSYHYKLNTALGVEKYMEFMGNPVKFGRQRRPKSMVKNTLTEAEITKLIFSCKNIKEKAIISLLAYSGIRNKELCNLRVRDFDAGTNKIQILKGKGLKDGISNISPECTNILLEYIYQNKKLQDEYLFTTYQGNQYTGFALRKLVKVVSKRTGILKRIFPHLFRHSLAVNLLARGANVVLLQRQLRHSLLETTLVYINSIVFSDRSDYQKFAPSYI